MIMQSQRSEIASLEVEPEKNEIGQTWKFTEEKSGPDTELELDANLLPTGEKASLSYNEFLSNFYADQLTTWGEHRSDRD